MATVSWIQLLSLQLLCLLLLQPAFSYVVVVAPRSRRKSIHCHFGLKNRWHRENFISLKNQPSQEDSTAAATVLTQSRSITPDDEFLNRVLQVAIEASKKAGDIIVGNAGGAAVTERKANSRDLLTLIDPLCEKVSMDSTFVSFECVLRKIG